MLLLIHAHINDRMLGLLDLNQSEPFVGSTLINWLCWTERDLDVDAFRVDAARHTWRDWLTWVPGNVGHAVITTHAFVA